MNNRAMNPDKMLIGVRIGGRCGIEDVLAEIRRYCASPLTTLCYILLQTPPSDELYCEWAKALCETETYFFLLPYHVEMSRETADKMRSVAGEYYLGNLSWKLNEWGTHSATAPYWVYDGKFLEEEKLDDLQVCFERNREAIREKIEETRELCGGMTTAFEATAHIKYLYEGGADIVIAELMNSYLEIQVACARGAARGYEKKEWGSLLAHEWYGGLDNDDPMKVTRLRLLYDYVYMAGSNYTLLESGEQNIRSYGVCRPEEHEICKAYRKAREDFTLSVKNDIRPAGGPLCKIGILHGNLDPYAGFGTSSLMFHRGNEDWTVKAAERSWDILKDVKKSIRWHEPLDFGEYSLSNAPAYGTYDIVPVESDISVLRNYDYLMFLGWNTMTEEIYEKLKEYVSQGGKLLIGAAHLNTNSKRDGKYIPLRGGKLGEFLGCDIVGSSRCDTGVKFLNNTMLDDVRYPAATTREATGTQVDQLLISGYADIADVDLCGGNPVAYSNDTYQLLPTDKPMLVENKFGKGIVSFVTLVDYPGAPEVRNFYSYIMKAQFTASHRACEVKVIAGDKIEFAVYDEGEGKRKIYLLNTDCSLANSVIIKTGREEIAVTLKPFERREITVSV